MHCMANFDSLTFIRNILIPELGQNSHISLRLLLKYVPEDSHVECSIHLYDVLDCSGCYIYEYPTCHMFDL